MIKGVNKDVTNLSFLVELSLRRTLVLPVLYSSFTIDHSLCEH